MQVVQRDDTQSFEAEIRVWHHELRDAIIGEAVASFTEVTAETNGSGGDGAWIDAGDI